MRPVVKQIDGGRLSVVWGQHRLLADETGVVLECTEAPESKAFKSLLRALRRFQDFSRGNHLQAKVGRLY